jgi:hypothetical protein
VLRPHLGFRPHASRLPAHLRLGVSFIPFGGPQPHGTPSVFPEITPALPPGVERSGMSRSAARRRPETVPN